MIGFENNDLKGNIAKAAIASIIAVVITFIIINFIPFSGMLDEFKISFKEDTIERIVKYYSITITAIILPIYIVLYFVIINLIKFVCNKIKTIREN